MLARRFVTPAIRKIAVQRFAPRVAVNFSTMLESKEHVEEARYIKQIEAQREAEVRKKLEAILALEAGHEEKQQLVELLGTDQFFSPASHHI